jgi:putative oxidoreductase
MNWLTWPALDKLRDVGLLVFRAGFGAMMCTHGYPKMLGGPEKWEKLGGAMASLGIEIYPVFWGFMASFAELVGGAMLVIGLGTRPAAAMLAFTMLVAAKMHLDGGDGLSGASHAIEDGFALIGLLVLGAGRYSVDARLRR